MRRTRLPPEEEAARVLARARHEWSALGETWSLYPVDVELVASLVFDLAVQRVPELKVGDKAYDGMLAGTARLIAVEANHHEHRQRFSVAHEVGHFSLHFLQDPSLAVFTCSDQDMKVRDAGRSDHARREWEANLFAAELLMPADQVEFMHRTVRGNLFKLSRHFSVSADAMEIRLKGLNLPFSRRTEQ